LRNLFYANKLFEEKDDAGREGIATACQAVARFIAVTHENPLLVAPLLALRAAILDVEKGVSNPILNPKAVDSHRSRSALKKHAIAAAAACCEALVELGEDAGEAAARVARAVSKWRIMGGQEITDTTIVNWRYHLRGSSTAERASFDLMRNDLLTCSQPQLQIDSLLLNGPPGIPKT
jgi:Xaa-Pro aminopeptidase